MNNVNKNLRPRRNKLKKERCPLCGMYLVPDIGTKMKCTSKKCKFIDKRCGNSVIDPCFDRRNGNKIPHAPGVNPWQHVSLYTRI